MPVLGLNEEDRLRRDRDRGTDRIEGRVSTGVEGDFGWRRFRRRVGDLVGVVVLFFQNKKGLELDTVERVERRGDFGEVGLDLRVDRVVRGIRKSGCRHSHFKLMISRNCLSIWLTFRIFKGL